MYWFSSSSSSSNISRILIEILQNVEAVEPIYSILL